MVVASYTIFKSIVTAISTDTKFVVRVLHMWCIVNHLWMGCTWAYCPFGDGRDVPQMRCYHGKLQVALYIGHNLTVEEADGTACIRGIVLRVGNHNNRCTFLMQLFEQSHHLLTVL